MLRWCWGRPGRAARAPGHGKRRELYGEVRRCFASLWSYGWSFVCLWWKFSINLRRGFKNFLFSDVTQRFQDFQEPNSVFSDGSGELLTQEKEGKLSLFGVCFPPSLGEMGWWGWWRAGVDGCHQAEKLCRCQMVGGTGTAAFMHTSCRVASVFIFGGHFNFVNFGYRHYAEVSLWRRNGISGHPLVSLYVDEGLWETRWLFLSGKGVSWNQSLSKAFPEQMEYGIMLWLKSLQSLLIHLPNRHPNLGWSRESQIHKKAKISWSEHFRSF